MHTLALFLSLFTSAAPPDNLPALVAALGSPRFRDRERASLELERLGAVAIPALEEAAESEDAEIRSRAARVVERYYTLLPEGKAFPWCDCWWDWGTVKEPLRPFFDQARSEGYSGADWSEYRRATQLFCYDRQRHGWPKWLLAGMLDRLAEREAEMRKKHGPKAPDF